MTRQRSNQPAAGNQRRTRGGGRDAPAARTRRRGTSTATAPTDLSDEEVRALLDENVDPDEVERVAREAEDDEQEASDHDRDTTRDRLESLLLEQDEDL